MPVTFADTLKRLREAKGLTQRELALATHNVSASYVGALEMGTRRASVKAVKALARGLNCTPEEYESLMSARERTQTEREGAQSELPMGAVPEQGSGGQTFFSVDVGVLQEIALMLAQLGFSQQDVTERIRTVTRVAHDTWQGSASYALMVAMDRCIKQSVELAENLHGLADGVKRVREQYEATEATVLSIFDL